MPRLPFDILPEVTDQLNACLYQARLYYPLTPADVTELREISDKFIEATQDLRVFIERHK